MDECRCMLDVDGLCKTCRTNLREVLGTMVDVQMEALAKVAQAASGLSRVCRGCGPKYVDIAVGDIVRDKLSAVEDRGLALKLLVCMAGIMQNMRVTASPQTQKAWRDLSRAKGWPEGA